MNDKVWFSDWYRQAKKATTQVYVAAYRIMENKNLASSTPTLSIIETMDNYRNLNNYEKVLRIDLDLSEIYDIIVRERDYLSLYLINGENKIVMSADSGYQHITDDPYPVFNQWGTVRTRARGFG